MARPEPEPAELAKAPADIERLAERFEREAARVESRQEWELLRLQWTGRKQGIVRGLLEGIRSVAPELRRSHGEAVNRLKARVEERLAELDQELAAAERRTALQSSAVDVTLPGRKMVAGSLHPVSLVTRDMEQIFAELGFSVAEGPEVEDDYHNFGALNYPPEHPARDAQDTFFVGGGRLLRSHTSPVQIRTMLARRPPIRVICPGRVYRKDNDLRHSPMFHQVEALVVAEGITVGDLKGTLEAFLKRLFTPETRIRLRPSFFPFTEPSAEVDVTCVFCRGAGCEVCSATGWMEILGCGMVDPRVLEECGIDSDVYSGFAFGMGADRVAMIRYDIPNIRVLFENDERLLRQVRG
ncbi:MAG TPA: phenylalanine--tRNA ligase subunit alpha [Thermoanaerobaculia bacterium]|nr:phenylalanine--tRNA ligase subunit alpha [Thermoanaerobaculia bacterium]